MFSASFRILNCVNCACDVCTKRVYNQICMYSIELFNLFVINFVLLISVFLCSLFCRILIKTKIIIIMSVV